MHCRPRARHLFRPAKRKLQLALQQREGFFKIMPVRRGPAARVHVHIDQRESPGGIFPRK